MVIIKTCEVRLIKMNIDKFANQTLLNMDGHPGKFYLDGFAPHEFVKLTKLITNYGGMVMSPDDETIILSKSDRPSDMKLFPLFHVNWLHDSLTQNTLQDIGKYLLPNYPHDSPRMISGTALKIQEIPEGFNQKASTQSNEYNGKSPRILKNRNSQKTVSPNIRIRGDESFVISQRSPQNQNIEEQVIKNESEVLTEHQKRSSQEQKENKKVKEGKRKRSPDPEDIYGEMKKKKKKDEENKSRSDDDDDGAEKTVNVLEESESSPSEGNAEGPNESIRVATSPEDANPTEERQDSVLKENEHDDSIQETSFVKKKKKRTPEEKDHVKRSSKPYSREENLKMFQFLKDNNLLAKANRDFVWDKAAASEIFQDPPRTASGLRQHFHKILLPNYLEYTSDPEVIAGLAKIEKRKLKNIIGYFNIKKADDGDDGASNSSLSD